MPARPASVSRSPADRHRQPRHLGQAAGDERGQRVVAEAEAVDDAGGDGDHVLQRAAELDADHVLARIQAQRRPAELVLDVTARRRRRATPRRPPSAARGRARRRSSVPTAPRRRDVRPLLVDHLRHPEQRAVLESLGGAEHTAPASTCGAAWRSTTPQAVRRHRDDDQLRGAQGLGQLRRWPPAPSGNVRIGQVDGVGSARLHLGRPAPRRGPTGVPRGRCAPGARPAPCPSCRRRAPRPHARPSARDRERRSVPAHSRGMLPRWCQAIRAAAAPAPSVTAGGAPESDRHRRQHDRRDQRPGRDDPRRCDGSDERDSRRGRGQRCQQRRTLHTRWRRPCRRGRAARPGRHGRRPRPRRPPRRRSRALRCASPAARHRCPWPCRRPSPPGRARRRRRADVGGAGVAAADAPEIDAAPAAREPQPSGSDPSR